MTRATILIFLPVIALAADVCTGPPKEATLQLPGSPFKLAVSNDGCTLYASMAGKHPGLAIIKRSGAGINVAKAVKTSPLFGLVLTHDGKLLIGTSGSSILFLDPASGDVLDKIEEQAGDEKIYANVTADDKALFVSNERSHSISVIDIATRKIEKRIQVGNAPIALTFSPDGKRLYTTSQAALPDWGWPDVCDPEVSGGTKHPKGAIVVIDVAKREVAAKVEAGCNPVRLALSPDGTRAYVTARKDNQLLVFDTAKLSRLAEISVGTAPVPVAVAGKNILVGNSNRFGSDSTEDTPITVINAVTNRVTGALAADPPGKFPRDILLSPDGLTIYVANFNSSTLDIFNARQP